MLPQHGQQRVEAMYCCAVQYSLRSLRVSEQSATCVMNAPGVQCVLLFQQLRSCVSCIGMRCLLQRALGNCTLGHAITALAAA